MDESSSGQEIASTIGNILRSLSDAGYEIQRLAIPRAVYDPRDRFAELVIDDQLRQASEALFRDGHYARAVEEAFKCLNNAVKSKSELLERDGADLMRAAFSANDPVLKLNEPDSTSARDEQRGYMDIYAGSMTGIRNPRAHDHELKDELGSALELLALANHLMGKLHASRRVKSPPP